MKKQKQMSPYLFLLGYIVLFITNVHAINTLRPNELIFSTGHYIKDGTNVEAGMTSPIPNNICYKKTQKSACEYTYEQYYVSEFPSNPVPGTMNIGLILDENDTEKDLRIMVSDFAGTSTVEPEPSIQGFTEDLINGTQGDPGVLAINYWKGDEYDNETPQGKDVNDGKNIIGAYTNFQVGKTRYGRSLWIYKDLEEDLLTIGGFDGVDWALEPVVANPFSINSITSQNLANATESENPGITYLTERIEVRDTDTGGRVCLFASGNCHEDVDTNGDGAPDRVPKAGLFIEGDALINKLFGLIGFVTQTSTSNPTGYNMFSGLAGTNKIGESITLNLDVNMDGNLTTADEVSGFMVTAIGYLGLYVDSNDNYTFWMVEGQSCNPTNMSLYSNTGIFDFQTGWNRDASFTFLYTKTFDTAGANKEDLVLSFCTNAPSQYVICPWWYSWYGMDPDDDCDTYDTVFSKLNYGAAVYGIPVSTTN